MNSEAGALPAIVALTLVYLTPVSATPMSGRSPQIGDTFALDPDKRPLLKGWRLIGESEAIDQTYALFKKNQNYLIAFSLPVGRDRRSGLKVEKIIRIEIVMARPKEIGVDGVICSPDGYSMPDITFYNASLGEVRGIFIESNKLITKRWPQKLDDCEQGDD